MSDDARRVEYDLDLVRREASDRVARQRRRSELVQRVDMSHARELLKSPFKLTFSACAVLLFWTYVATPILAGLKKPWERAPIVAADRDAARMRAILA